MRDFPTIDSKSREGKKFVPSVPTDDAPTKRHLYELCTRGEKTESYDD